MEISRQFIKDNLVYGDQKTIAKIIGVSELTVRQHINGRVKRPSYLILKEAMRLIKERNEQEKEIQGIISEITPEAQTV